jgi:hypothetical protein
MSVTFSSAERVKGSLPLPSMQFVAITVGHGGAKHRGYKRMSESPGSLWPPLLRKNRRVADTDREMVSLTVSRADWRLIQEALDTEFYETEHWEPGGLTKGRRVRNRERRQARMAHLTRLDEAIGQATGLGPL